MGLILASVRLFFLTSLLALVTAVGANNGYKAFNVKKYGAISDGKTENSKAFLKAWTDACQWHGKAMVLIPPGVYILDSVLFSGECNGYMAFYLKGILKPKGNLQTYDQWITFRYVNGFFMGGGGFLDGEGYKLWNRNDCQKNNNCHPLAISLRLEFIENGKISHIRSINSQNAHISLFGCININMSKLRLSAPDYCPYPPCDMATPSRIQIKDITFNNIWGTSESKVAVTLNCSRTVPCKNIQLKDINLFRRHGDNSVWSLCSNVRGISYGHQRPPSCF
ncbi:unnamed protein product [Dovyalis caffra]|uniref:Exopolygalacturonase n=1 Tax=Dovyalis caffra TaxID=77055 RepID=A0AAV1SJP7_9ROSI|nr:unnamed protein product [Dovyalis caffra]